MAREYLTMGVDLLRTAPPRLIAIGGLSGSGKSTLARSLAPSIGSVPGALLLRSDVIRKHLCCVDELDHLGPEGYTADVTSRVYHALAAHAHAALTAGHSVIVDAVCARPADRAAIEAVAADANVPFTGLWLDAPAAVLTARIDHREPDASDADASIVRRQLSQDLGTMTWLRINAADTPSAVLAQVQSRLSDQARRTLLCSR
jgi:predicted kinase